MRAFWAAGYEATSTQDLCAATGLGRSSVYNTFASKHDLFEKALVRYMETKSTAAEAVLASARPVREKVRVLLWRAVDGEPEDPVGCLVVNAMVELAPKDSRIAALLARDYDRRLEALRVALEAGRRAGEIAADRDPRQLAHFVISSITGLVVLARSGADRSALEAVATSVLAAL
ncbi:transcriptional regulator, TetR family [Streptoalloteichus hindustanus]|uniref:Transcriptional regulator, TetR family n=2 Tax=Streptoalloteichus hindustanus TaxID=2017 RepID=A0A1M5DMK2_STRHI|nr:transcriptional regulator, TetR family [Streptoalloteichus hindustanus]